MQKRVKLQVFVNFAWQNKVKYSQDAVLKFRYRTAYVNRDMCVCVSAAGI